MPDAASPAPGATGVPAATFLNFLSGFSAQALMQLGAIPHPLTGERTPNLAYARYTVQVLEVLRDKTNGNRTPEEEQYLAGVLTDLSTRLAALSHEAPAP